MQDIIQDKYRRNQIKTQKKDILNYMCANQIEVPAGKTTKKELIKIINQNANISVRYRVSQKGRTNGALRCRRDYRKRQKNVKKILLHLFADLAVFESGT
jgi:hypothetical protein